MKACGLLICSGIRTSWSFWNSGAIVVGFSSVCVAGWCEASCGCDIGTLIVRGGEYAKSRAFKLKSVKDDLGLGSMTVAYIPDPETYEGLARDLNAKSLSDNEDWDEDPEADSDLDSDHEDDDEDE